jgi:ADP-ribose pyrophosphatase YjhB (NUDIX family)
MVDVGEKLEDAARREIQEETGLDVTLECLLSVYSAPERDPRRHVVSAVYVGQAKGVPKADDDAKHAQLFAIDELPALLAFDHQQILADYRAYRETGAFPPPRPSSK